MRVRAAFTRIAKGDEPKYGLLEMKFGSRDRQLEVCAILDGLCLRQGVLVDRMRKSKGRISTKAESVPEKASHNSPSEQVSIGGELCLQRVLFLRIEFECMRLMMGLDLAEKIVAASAVSGRSLEVIQDEGTPDLPKKKSCRAADVGSSKRSKRRKTFIDLIEEVDCDEHVSCGVERKGVEFLDGDDRHVLFESGLADLAKSIVQLRQKPV